MELLGNYSEDEEEESVNNASESVRENIKEDKIVTTSISTNRGKQTAENEENEPKKKNIKKRKKLDISFLPENIQVALARGDTGGDSDSDQEEKSQVTTKTLPPEKKSANELLSKLPKPKSSNSLDLGKKTLRPAISVPQPQPEIERISTNKVNSLPQKEATHGVEISDNSEDSENSDSDDVDEVIMIPKTASSTNTSHTSNTVPAAASSVFAEPPIVLPSFQFSTPAIPSISNIQSTPSYNPYLSSSSSSSSSSSYFNSQENIPSAGSAHSNHHHQQQQQYQQQYQQQQQQQQQKKKSNFRKRDREIESSLLRGDTSLLDPNSDELFNPDNSNGLEGRLIDVQHSHEWNSDYYYSQQKRQKELQSIFNFKQNGGDKMLAQPTKLQNKRHQINSLVMSAAESELELLEAKGRQMKTKFETQSKYGW